MVLIHEGLISGYSLFHLPIDLIGIFTVEFFDHGDQSSFSVLTSKGDLWFLPIMRSTSLSPSLEGYLRTSGRFSILILPVVTPVLSFTLLRFCLLAECLKSL